MFGMLKGGIAPSVFGTLGASKTFLPLDAKSFGILFSSHLNKRMNLREERVVLISVLESRSFEASVANAGWSIGPLLTRGVLWAGQPISGDASFDGLADVVQQQIPFVALALERANLVLANRPETTLHQICGALVDVIIATIALPSGVAPVLTCSILLVTCLTPLTVTVVDAVEAPVT